MTAMRPYVAAISGLLSVGIVASCGGSSDSTGGVARGGSSGLGGAVQTGQGVEAGGSTGGGGESSLAWDASRNGYDGASYPCQLPNPWPTEWFHSQTCLVDPFHTCTEDEVCCPGICLPTYLFCANLGQAESLACLGGVQCVPKGACPAAGVLPFLGPDASPESG